MIGEFEDTIDSLLAALMPGNRDEAAAIVREYLEIRGYGPVKEDAMEAACKRIAERRAAFANTPARAA
jgi:indolepyruvate ferredoxin oxidoreductase